MSTSRYPPEKEVRMEYTGEEHASEAPPPAYPDLDIYDRPSSSSLLLTSTDEFSSKEPYYQDQPPAVKPASAYAQSSYSYGSSYQTPGTCTHPPYARPGPQAQHEYQYRHAARDVSDFGFTSRSWCGARRTPFPGSGLRGIGSPYYGSEAAFMSNSSFNDAGVLSSPPMGFGRPPRADLPYGPFQPCTLVSLSDTLERGFVIAPPPCQEQVHPFTTHDVNEEDWVYVLQGIETAAGTSQVDPALANSRMNAGFLGMLISAGMEMSTKSKRQCATLDLIAQWNQSFFHPRQMELLLAQGNVVYNDPRRPPCGKEQKEVKHEKWRLIVAYKPPNM